MTRYTHFKKSFNPSEINQKTQSASDRPDRKDAKIVKFPGAKFRHQRQQQYQQQDGQQYTKKMCLKCRKPGHAMKDCPEAQNAGQAQSYCYNCGEGDHSTKQCPLPFSNYAHALCFHCNTKGHLASACPKNERGIYPNGGCCHYCGSVRHLARNCKPTQATQKGDEILISANLTACGNPEDDDVHEALRRIQQDRGNHEKSEAKKVKKVVKF